MTAYRNLASSGLIFGLAIGLGALGPAACRQGTPAANESAVNATDTSSPTLVGDMDESLPANAIEPMKQRAMRGDNAAANGLGNYYSQLRNVAEERRWRTLAADRGDCLQITLLKDLEEHAGNRRARVHWNEMLRRHACTWGKAYGPHVAPELSSMPLWD